MATAAFILSFISLFFTVVLLMVWRYTLTAVQELYKEVNDLYFKLWAKDQEKKQETNTKSNE